MISSSIGGIHMNKNMRTIILPKGEIIPPIYDFMFTTIFNKEENLIILENFLSYYLDIPLEKIKGKISILSRNLKLENKHTANKQVDLLLNLEGRKINIEVSTHLSSGIINRNLVFACNAHATSYRYGDRDYSKIEETIQINLVYDKAHPVGEKFRETYYMRNEEGKLLTKKLRIDYVNIAKLEEPCYTVGEDEVEDFCRMLIMHKEEEFKKLIGGMRMEKEAKEKIEEEVLKYSRDEEVVAIYSDYTKEELERNTILIEETEEARKQGYLEGHEQGRREGHLQGHKEGHKEGHLQGHQEGLQQGLKEGLQEGIQKGIQKGIEQGKEENTIQIAKNMLNQNMDIFLISKVTGLSKDQIETLY